MSQLERGDNIDALRRRWGIRGELDPVDLSDSIFPVQVIEGDRPETMALANQRRCSTVMSQGAGGAGIIPLFQLFNPFDSGVLITCDNIVVKLFTNPAGAGDPILELWIDGTALGNNATNPPPHFQDSRVQGNPTGQGRYAASAAVPGTYLDLERIPLHSLAGTGYGWYVWPPQGCQRAIVLGPNSGVGIDCQNANIVAQAVFSWYERPMGQLEGIKNPQTGRWTL